MTKRFIELGEVTFIENSRATQSTPHGTSREIEEAIIKLRKQYPNRGARKLKVLLVEVISNEIILLHQSEEEIQKKRIYFPSLIQVYLMKFGVLITKGNSKLETKDIAGL